MSSVAFAHPTCIFDEGHIQRPMQSFNFPVPTHASSKGLDLRKAEVAK